MASKEAISKMACPALINRLQVFTLCSHMFEFYSAPDYYLRELPRGGETKNIAFPVDIIEKQTWQTDSSWNEASCSVLSLREFFLLWEEELARAWEQSQGSKFPALGPRYPGNTSSHKSRSGEVISQLSPLWSSVANLSQMWCHAVSSACVSGPPTYRWGEMTVFGRSSIRSVPRLLTGWQFRVYWWRPIIFFYTQCSTVCYLYTVLNE